MMPVSSGNATSVTQTPLWDLSTGARHVLICDVDPDRRADTLASVFASIGGLPDVTVWADQCALTAVKQPEDITFGYHAAGARNAVDMLGLAVELADARRATLEYRSRWLYPPARNGRLVVVVADLATLNASQLARARRRLERLLEAGRRTAMPVVALADPAATPAELLGRLSTACASWPLPAPAAARREVRELVAAGR